jgi:hypothetical protein
VNKRSPHERSEGGGNAGTPDVALRAHPGYFGLIALIDRVTHAVVMRWIGETELMPQRKGVAALQHQRENLKRMSNSG